MIRQRFFSSAYFYQTQNTVYEIVSDMSSRQDAVEERLTNLEDKIQTLQVSESICPISNPLEMFQRNDFSFSLRSLMLCNRFRTDFHRKVVENW